MREGWYPYRGGKERPVVRTKAVPLLQPSYEEREYCIDAGEEREYPDDASMIVVGDRAEAGLSVESHEPG